VAYRLLRPALFALDPERAHDLVLGSLRLLDRALPEGSPAAGDLPVTVAGLAFPNPIGLAAGFDKDGVATRALAALGFGFLEVGTVTPEPQPGNPRPRMFRIPERRAVLNRLGFNSGGSGQAAYHLRRRTRRVPVGVNVGPNRGTAPDQVVPAVLAAVRRLAPLADYLVLNLSSPNTPGLRDLLGPGHLAETLSGLISTLAAEGIARPLFLKVSPDTTDADRERIAATAVEARTAGLIATNTTVARDGVPAGWSEQAGGVSGEPLRERADRALAVLARATGGRLPLIGVGGVASGEDAYRKIRLGASLVQLYTGLVYEGPGLVGRIRADVARRLAADGFASVSAAVGTGL
jgi:dihydroorotate dehydrogenase